MRTRDGHRYDCPDNLHFCLRFTKVSWPPSAFWHRSLYSRFSAKSLRYAFASQDRWLDAQNIPLKDISVESREALVELCRMLLLPFSGYRNSALSVVYEAVRLGLSLVQAANFGGSFSSSFGSSRQASGEVVTDGV